MNQSSATSSVSPLAPVAAHRGARVAIISASWHQDIVHQARDAALAEFDRHGLPPAQVALFDVPGAFEIPLLARKLARSGRYDAIVACALVSTAWSLRRLRIKSGLSMRCSMPSMAATLSG